MLNDAMPEVFPTPEIGLPGDSGMKPCWALEGGQCSALLSLPAPLQGSIGNLVKTAERQGCGRIGFFHLYVAALGRFWRAGLERPLAFELFKSSEK